MKRAKAPELAKKAVRKAKTQNSNGSKKIEILKL